MPANVRYQAGYSNATGLPDGCADIVTCSQSLHWMEPESTFAEIARILRPGGVFAAYDCDWPPTFSWQVEQAYSACHAQAHAAEQAHQLSREVRSWDKGRHLERIRASERFRFTKEIVLHHVEQGGAERLIGLMLSQGGIATLLKHGVERGRDRHHRAARGRPTRAGRCDCAVVFQLPDAGGGEVTRLVLRAGTTSECTQY